MEDASKATTVTISMDTYRYLISGNTGNPTGALEILSILQNAFDLGLTILVTDPDEGDRYLKISDGKLTLS
ncbi:MAG: hypothetical protein D0530_00570 [Methylococcales bacterium]|nr:MAG: hypothetical protein D0530_00570 [Methylococcales bacterium]